MSIYKRNMFQTYISLLKYSYICCFLIVLLPSTYSKLHWKLCLDERHFISTFEAYRGCEFDTKKTDFGWCHTLITHIVQVAVDGQKHGVLDCRGAGQV